jgi:hypothetical protein
MSAHLAKLLDFYPKQTNPISAESAAVLGELNPWRSLIGCDRCSAKSPTLSTGELNSAFETWLETVEGSLLPSDLLSKAVRYYRNHGEALFRFIDDPEVPIDNSPTEREFQNFAKLRLNMLFAGSTEGAHRAAVLLGIVATCRALEVPCVHHGSSVAKRIGHEKARAPKRPDLNTSHETHDA